MYVYIMASHRGTVYVGVTNDLLRRVEQHRDGSREGFTSRYKANRLVYYEVTEDVHSAIAREKQIKGWKRWRKLALIRESNPEWKDLGSGLN